MASEAFIVAHDNIFNRSILGKDALYFKSEQDVADIIKNYPSDLRPIITENNLKKIKTSFQWHIIAKQYLDLFQELSLKDKIF